MSRFWVWLSHPYNIITIFELHLSPLCFIFVIRVLVHRLHLQGCFSIVRVLLVVAFHEILSPRFVVYIFGATSFSSSIVGWNSLTWFLWFSFKRRCAWMVGVWIGWFTRKWNHNCLLLMISNSTLLIFVLLLFCWAQFLFWWSLSSFSIFQNLTFLLIIFN